jgi:site-specific DNA recombinase
MSAAHDGWTLIRSRYDDGGYSGGSTERPAICGWRARAAWIRLDPGEDGVVTEW